MTLTAETKANKMRAGFGKLASEYVSEGRNSEAASLISAAKLLNGNADGAKGINEHWARLYDILTAA